MTEFLVGAAFGAAIVLLVIHRYARREGRMADILRRVTRP
jgi:hypothetical protein